jgi:hypothetical protein
LNSEEFPDPSFESRLSDKFSNQVWDELVRMDQFFAHVSMLDRAMQKLDGKVRKLEVPIELRPVKLLERILKEPEPSFSP